MADILAKLAYFADCKTWSNMIILESVRIDLGVFSKYIYLEVFTRHIYLDLGVFLNGKRWSSRFNIKFWNYVIT